MAVSTVGPTGLSSAVGQLGKNLIQNGKFEVNQRGSTTVAAGAAGYGPDRWSVLSGATAAYTLTSDTSVPAGQGFLNSFKVDITTADSSISSGENYYVEHRIEGSDCRHLMLGTANAKTVTLQFWARSQVTGIHCVSLQNNASNRSYPFEYTIATADTWEYFTETIALDTGGTWLTTTGIGLRVRWSLGAGSSYQGTGDTWEAARDDCTSNQVNAVASTGQFGLAGVQLEVGSATDFENEPVSVSLAKAQRYFKRFSGAAALVLSGTCRSTTAASVNANIGPMRAAPTGSVSAAAWSNVVDDSDSGRDSNNTPSWTTNADGGVSTSVTVASGLTDGNGVVVEGKASQYAQFSAEL